MPALPEILEKAREAARRVDELEEQAKKRKLWADEVDRLTHEVDAAVRGLEQAVSESERARSEARASGGFLGAIRDRLAGNLPQGRALRVAQKHAVEQTAEAKRLAAEALCRRMDAELEEARRKLLLAEGALGSRAGAKLNERKAFITLAGLTENEELEKWIGELSGQERRCEAWRSAQRAAAARRDHSAAALGSLQAFEKAWPALHDALGDIVHGTAAKHCPPEALEHLKKARHELYMGTRIESGLNKGVLAELAAIPAHEIERPQVIARVAGVLTRALQDLKPIAEAALKSCADLESNLSTAEENCERLRVKIHERILALPGGTHAGRAR